MAQNNSTDIDTIATSKPGLVTDLNSTYVGKENYSYARNLVRASKDGDLGTMGNEPSNEWCFNAPYKIVGTISLPDDTIMIFSGENGESEIGIGDYKSCTYTTLLSMPCLAFDSNYPVTGVAKKDFQKGIVVTFTDKKNPVRRLVLKDAKKVSCDDILLFKKIDWPCLSVKKGNGGNIPNGSYSVAMAYVVDGQIFSDVYSITNRISLFSETGSNSLEVTVDKLDKEFKEFSLIVVGNYIDPVTKGATKLIKKVGTYSTKNRVISITDFVNDDYENIKPSQLVIKKNTWKTAGIISSNSNYLILGDLVGREEEDYQLKAMSIKAQYVVEQVEADYYERDGEDVGYYRDENYDFYIQGVYSTGEVTDKYHIPGREASADDRSIVASADVHEHDEQFKDCIPHIEVPKWQVENTAEEMIPYNNEFVCGRRVLGYGKMGYWENTEKYPDNPATFGEWANTPQRFHKMPDECRVPRYQTINSKTYINILGVRFTNIPSFDNPDIVGYLITRSDRKGGNGTVIARGLMTNIRSYTDSVTGEETMYSNYGVNDLSPDQFLSSTQTSWKNKKENNYNPLSNYYKDKFSFYSPHTFFEPRYSLGAEIKIESEEIADITGQFEKVYNHPKAKLMNQFSFWLSASVGFIESTLILLGKGDHKAEAERVISALGIASGTSQSFRAEAEYNISSVEDLISLDLVGFITSKVLAGDITVFTRIKNAIQAILALGLKVPYSIFAGIKQADETMKIIQDFTAYTDYVYQYNSHASFNRSLCQVNGQKRRRLLSQPYYIPSDVVSIEDKVFNNYFRERCVYLELNKAINDPRTVDNSRQTMSSFGICDDIATKTKSVGSAFYVTNKAINPNQYGRIGSCMPVSMHSCPLSGDTTPILYGGDCIITRFSFQKRMKFFTQDLANTNYPAGVEYDYRMYRNIGYPRFWMDTTKYDFSELLSSNVVNFTRFSRTTAGKYNLDCKGGKDGQAIARIDNAYMYTSYNTVLDFFVEADYNVNFREKTEYPFYSKKSTNLSQIFRSDRLDKPEEFSINRVYSDIYTTEIYAQIQREDFDPLNKIPTDQSNSVIYSLPSFNLQEVDNWQYFLPGNFFSFRESDFGQLTAIKKIDQDRLVFLFSKASPFVSMGRDFLQLEGTGRKITVGDAGLFAQDPRETFPTDTNYGGSTSKYAFSNTHLGRFYLGETQGRIFSFSEGAPDDITRQGMAYWCKNYMPIRFYDHFPSYSKIENPINGVGYLTAFDSFTETLYITKRDFIPKHEEITYEKGQFFFKGNIPISIHDSNYFTDISWTLSYSPLDKGFISWHDWHPDWTIQTDNHFLTVKGNGVWKHNERWDSYCNFYGKDYPFEVGVLSSSGQQIETVRSLEYLLEAYHYKNRGRDRFHVLNENFDRLIVKNTEQISPLLNLVLANPNPEQNLKYPAKSPANNISYDIPFFKEENKYRVNMFWDATKDRGEFSRAENHLFPTDESGYRSVINPMAIDIDKPETERKKFRHYFHEFRLIKTVSGASKFLFKLLNIKKQISIR